MKWTIPILLILCSCLAYVSCPNSGDQTGITLDQVTNITYLNYPLSVFIDANASTGNIVCSITTTYNNSIMIDYIQGREKYDPTCITEPNFLYTTFFDKDELVMHDGKLRYQYNLGFNKYQVGETYELLLECGTDICYKYSFDVIPARVPLSTSVFNFIWSWATDPLGWVYTFIILIMLSVLFRGFLKEIGLNVINRILRGR
jgi:hypothetical protein